MSGRLYIGIDAGSSATKCVVLDENRRIVGHAVVPSGFDYGEAAEKALSESLTAANATRDNIAGCVSTGYGRDHVAPADRKVTEITSHARGAREWCPEVRSIIDIGGQDTKVIRIGADGRMADYRMNAKCAAGTGTFLESIALKLGLPLSELDALAMQSKSETSINSYCTVFAGTEVIERIKEGQAREDISMGLFRSIATRVFEMLSARNGMVGATGGVVAHCRAMVRALNEVLDTEVRLPPMPQLAGAYGAALIAMESKVSESPDHKESDASHAATR